MLVQIATMMIAMVGMLGLVVDFGFAAMERRTLQNAADAAALTGAIDLVQMTNQAVTNTVVNDVSTMSLRNGAATTATIDCAFVNNGNADTGACSSWPASGSDGVRVRATTTRETFFIRVLGIDTVTVSAESIARISAWQYYNAGAGPFIVCGYQTFQTNGQQMDILVGNKDTGPWGVNPAAIGKTFMVHAPQSNGNNTELQDCGAPSAKFKGLNGETGWKDVPDWFASKNGTKAGPTNAVVNGIDGCNGTALSGCVVLLPIASKAKISMKLDDDDKKDQKHEDDFYVVMWLPFELGQPHVNKHSGRLLGTDYVIRQEDGTILLPWMYGLPAGPTSVRTVR
jgi:Flp pilus assembly protein TadG